MSIDKSTVSKIANLARIHVTEEDLDYYAPQIQKILAFAEQLQGADTDGVAPLASVSDIVLPLRKDVVTDGNIAEQVLKNAPESTEGFFVVTKIVE